MKITQFKELMTANNGAYIYEAFVPSLDTEISLTSMSTGQAKSIIKSAMPEKYNVNNDIKRLNLIAELIINDEDTKDIDITDLCFIDIVSILSSIRINNPISNSAFTYNCPECEEKFEYTPNFEDFEKNCKLHDIIKSEKSYKNDEVEIKFEIYEPKMLDEISYNTYSQSVMELEHLEENEKLTSIMSNIYIKYIKDININGEELEGWKDLKFMEKMELLNSFPAEFIYAEDGILKHITELLVAGTVVFKNIECPHCNHDCGGGMSLDAFFIV